MVYAAFAEKTVQFVIRNDRSGHFRFASLQSTAARNLLSDVRYEDDSVSPVVLLTEGKLYRKSRAAL